MSIPPSQLCHKPKTALKSLKKLTTKTKQKISYGILQGAALYWQTYQKILPMLESKFVLFMKAYFCVS